MQPLTSYRVERISPGSALRLGLLLGWLVVLLPAAISAWLMTMVLGQAAGMLGQMSPYEISLLGQTVTSLDPLSVLGLTDIAATISKLNQQADQLFWMLTAGLTLAGGFGVALIVTLMAVLYNLLAAIGGGLRLELRYEAGSQ